MDVIAPCFEDICNVGYTAIIHLITQTARRLRSQQKQIIEVRLCSIIKHQILNSILVITLICIFQNFTLSKVLNEETVCHFQTFHFQWSLK